LRTLHPKQSAVTESKAKRKIVRAGRRSGKTTGAADEAVDDFLDGRRVLYATPTDEQLGRFWAEVKRALAEPIEAGVYYKNETKHIIELPSTEQRIRGKTAWNADTLRGDYADKLILDEWQLMDEDTWGLVGVPMLLDNNGDALFIYTPPSLRSRSVSKARDPRHAAKMWKMADEDTTGRWEAFHFSSHDNPHISRVALAEISKDMTRAAYEQEILALDKDEDPDALWTMAIIEDNRVTTCPDLGRVIVGVDPSGGVVETGILVAGRIGEHAYVLEDATLRASPEGWSEAVQRAYRTHQADRVVAEINFGGDMVEAVLRATDGNLSYKAVHASRGKQIRAEPIAALYERGLVHHVGDFPLLEDEMTLWVPGLRMPSPNRLDALVWALTELMMGKTYKAPGVVRYA
jgi:hypothetical protein